MDTQKKYGLDWACEEKTKFDILLVRLSVIIVAIILTLAVFTYTNYSNSKYEACKALGLEKYVVGNGLSYCSDIDGNLHYVEISNCTILGYNCVAKKITVGDVEVKK